MPDAFAPTLLADRAFFISGGGSGVNLAIAEVIAQLGGSLAICGRTPERLDAARALLEGRGARVVTAVADVRDPAAVASALACAAEELGPMDGVVCGAAGNFVAEARDLSSGGFRAVVEIDLLGSFHVASAAFEQLRETRGSVLFVSGGPSFMALAGQAHAGAAKAGVDQLMRTLAVEWAQWGIRSNSIVPGPVAGTEGMRRLAQSSARGAWEQSVPLGRYAEPEEVGAMAAMLLSPIAAYVTGTQILVDGGLSLSGPGLVNVAAAQQRIGRGGCS